MLALRWLEAAAALRYFRRLEYGMELFLSCSWPLLSEQIMIELYFFLLCEM